MLSIEQQAKATERFLASTYPVFVENKPLVIGVHLQLAERHPEIDPKVWSRVLLWHCRRPRYLQALVSIPERYDLEGNPAGAVSEADREVAAKYLKLQLDRWRADAQRRKENVKREKEAARLRAVQKQKKEQERKTDDGKNEIVQSRVAKSPVVKSKAPLSLPVVPKSGGLGRSTLSLKGRKSA